MLDISRYVKPTSIFFLEVPDRDIVLHTMATSLQESGVLDDAEAFYQALLNREQIVTTGIGMGIAIPHAKLPEYDDFFIAVAILKKGVDWKALDSAPVRLILMIGGPDDKQTEYLQILSSLTSLLRDEDRRRKLLIAESPEAVLDLLKKH